MAAMSSTPAVPPPAPPADDTRSLTRLYIAALSAVALLSIGGQFLVQTRLERQSADATIVNIAGRQRMMSQRLAKCALLVVDPPDAKGSSDRIQELRELLPLWRRCHEGLQKGDPQLEIPYVDDPQSAAMFREIDPAFQAMYDGASVLLADLEAKRPVTRTSVDAILAREGEFLHGMDRIVSYYEMEAQKRVARLRSVESVFLALTLTVLLFEGTLVFRPATRRIRDSFAAQRRAHEALCRAHEQLRLAKNAAEAANQAKSRFLANVSHELRTPLHAVLGGVELLEDMSLDDRAREYADMIGDAAQAQLGLVNDLLDLSMIEEGKAELRPQAFRLRTMVERTCGMLRPMAAARGLTLRCRIEESVPAAVVGDELRLRQVLVNLINNAIKFTDSGTIDCRVGTVDNPAPPAGKQLPPAASPPVLSPPVRNSHPPGPIRVRFEVVDTGIGIAENDRSRIFDRFTQVDDSSERRRGGAGLGLAICAQWVERMGGRIEVESRPGEGSRFCFELLLPVATIADAGDDRVAAKTGRVERPFRALRILLADDAPAGRLIVAELLRQAGHDVLAVADGRAAVEAAAGERFDAALIDVQMPELDGPGAVAAIREAEQAEGRLRLPIAALTADAIGADSRKLEEAGFDTKLTKPISAAGLLAALTKLVDEATPRAAAEVDGVPRTEGSAHSPFPISHSPFDSRLSHSPLSSPPPTALDRLRGNEKLLAELTEMFAAESVKAIDSLKEGLASGDCEGVFRTAHRLRGQLLLIGADEAAAIAEAIERSGHEGHLTAAAARMNDLTTALDAVGRVGRASSTATTSDDTIER
jgi:signal transduction histidine kinase/DNA-binding NarL/FixJ family response regulator/HPt (histidine-containing phosphotransfer) domain-containing protein